MPCRKVALNHRSWKLAQRGHTVKTLCNKTQFYEVPDLPSKESPGRYTQGSMFSSTRNNKTNLTSKLDLTMYFRKKMSKERWFLAYFAPNVSKLVGSVPAATPSPTLARKKRKSAQPLRKGRHNSGCHKQMKEMRRGRRTWHPSQHFLNHLKEKDAIIHAATSGNVPKIKKKPDDHAAREAKRSSFYEWLMDMRAKNIPLTREVVQQKAWSFACLFEYREFKASTGWLFHLKEQYRIARKVLSGEPNSVNQTEAGEWLSENMPEILGRKLHSGGYLQCGREQPFSQILPRKTLNRKGETSHGGKQGKQRQILLLCMNVDGSDKCSPLITGKSAKPRCFKGLKKLSAEYALNTKAWMTLAIFSKWLKEFYNNLHCQKKRCAFCLTTAWRTTSSEVQLKSVQLCYSPTPGNLSHPAPRREDYQHCEVCLHASGDRQSATQLGAKAGD